MLSARSLVELHCFACATAMLSMPLITVTPVLAMAACSLETSPRLDLMLFGKVNKSSSHSHVILTSDKPPIPLIASLVATAMS